MFARTTNSLNEKHCSIRKNPFASGCRGISAKRSQVGLSHMAATDADDHDTRERVLEYDGARLQHRLSSLIDLITARQSNDPHAFGPRMARSIPIQVFGYYQLLPESMSAVAPSSVADRSEKK